MARTLRGIGIGNILLGVIEGVIAGFILAGGIAPSSQVMLIIGVVFGFFCLALIAEGIWLIAAPSAAGLLVAAISMFVAAVLFIRGILGLLILVFYGIELLKRHKKYGPLMEQRPDRLMMEQATVLLNKLQKSARKKAPDLIEFSSAEAFARHLWRGLLQENLIVLVRYDLRAFRRSIADVYFLSPGELNIDVSRKEVLGKWLKGTLTVQGQKFNGTIPPECYARYEQWVKGYLATITGVAQSIP